MIEETEEIMDEERDLSDLPVEIRTLETLLWNPNFNYSWLSRTSNEEGNPTGLWPEGFGDTRETRIMTFDKSPEDIYTEYSNLPTHMKNFLVFKIVHNGNGYRITRKGEY